MRLMRAHRSCFVLILFLLVDVSVSASFDLPPSLTGLFKKTKTLKEYLDRLGYTPLTNDLQSAIEKYQENIDLPVTGNFSLKDAVLQPRCGVPDIINGTNTMNSITASFKPWWKTEDKEVSYAFYPRNNVNYRVRTVFRKAFDRWSNETSLNFTETVKFNASDIRIYFGTWDGKGGFVGAAFANYRAMFLDIEEKPVMLMNVVMHEIGHLLGLGHSSVKESIMYPIVMQEKVQLADDDRKRIQQVKKDSNDGSATASSRGTDTSGGGGDGSVWRRNLVLGFAFMAFGIF